MTKFQNAQEYIALQRQAIASNPECGTSHYNLGVALMGLKQYSEAEAEFQEAISCSPTLAEAYVQLGGIRLQQGDLEGCLYYNKQSVKTRAGFAEGWGNVGFCQLQLGNLEEAIYALEKAVRWNKKFLQARATLANAYLMNGQVDESIAVSQKVLEQQPEFAVAHNNLAIAYIEKGHHDLAIEHCDKARDLGYDVAPQILAELEKHR